MLLLSIVVWWGECSVSSQFSLGGTSGSIALVIRPNRGPGVSSLMARRVLRGEGRDIGCLSPLARIGTRGFVLNVDYGRRLSGPRILDAGMDGRILAYAALVWVARKEVGCPRDDISGSRFAMLPALDPWRAICTDIVPR